MIKKRAWNNVKNFKEAYGVQLLNRMQISQWFKVKRRLEGCMEDEKHSKVCRRKL